LTLALPANTKYGNYNEDPSFIENNSMHHKLPFGTLIECFIVDNQIFEIFLVTAKDTGATEFLNKAEKVAIWFIETADSVDFSDERWEALFLFRKNIKNITTNTSTTTTTTTLITELSSSDTTQETDEVFFAGYFTLFTFNNPIVGSKIRICQALILPHLQNFGLGKKMLHTIHKLANERSHVVEITVEDPAVAFQRLRDVVDFECFLNLHSS
jgi:histone acetyltransferase 1